MKNNKIYAVITGDLVGSSRFKIDKQREEVLSNLKDSFKKIESPDIIASPFAIFRGDSFQGIISHPEEALKLAIILRANLLSKFKGKKVRLDARIAIGLGSQLIIYPKKMLEKEMEKLLDTQVGNLTI